MLRLLFLDAYYRVVHFTLQSETFMALLLSISQLSRFLGDNLIIFIIKLS